jgi:hypothetical protein
MSFFYRGTTVLEEHRLRLPDVSKLCFFDTWQDSLDEGSTHRHASASTGQQSGANIHA